MALIFKTNLSSRSFLLRRMDVDRRGYEFHLNSSLMHNPIMHFFNIIGKKRNLPRRFIYCSGGLLKTIQMAGLFPNSKVFVDKKLKIPVYEVLMNYENMCHQFGKHHPTKEALRDFISEHFEDSKELELWIPPDWKSTPQLINKIADKNLKKWATKINAQWTHLGRKVTEEVKSKAQLYSLIPVPHGFLIPGENLKELYYWDSYWIVNGLLKCSMWNSAKDIIKNFIYLVSKYNYVPTGTRIYFKGRSQPPLLPMMMESFYNHTKDLEFLRNNIETMEKEMEYWKKFRSVIARKNGFEYKMFLYHVPSELPRPEAFKADMESAILADTPEEFVRHFTALTSASESGWNLSSRWYVQNGYNTGTRSNIQTQIIVPVDLNAIMHKNLALFSEWYTNLGDTVKAKKCQCEAESLLRAIEVILWNENQGIWLDYDLHNNIQRDYFYISNLVPLWTKSYKEDPKKITGKVLKYLHENKVDTFPGGVPASLEDSGELWDFPYCWPPLQAFLVQGLDRLGTPVGTELAFHFAEKFINCCYKEYQIHGSTHPYYDCYGSGYSTSPESSSGYGWTNAIILEFLDRWGDQMFLSSEDKDDRILITKDSIFAKGDEERIKKDDSQIAVN
ncbi:trehalase isoform X1 [Halyomorpha halys]|uniref:trehalase isoform X1 n=2 Tax=Halyomorpha halys TaxID=286706 RepID=UPI0006D52867